MPSDGITQLPGEYSRPRLKPELGQNSNKSHDKFIGITKDRETLKDTMWIQSRKSRCEKLHGPSFFINKLLEKFLKERERERRYR